MLICISNRELDELKKQAQRSPRKRKNFNFHKVDHDPLQRMMHAMNPGTYVQPHKHENPDKREAFIILDGRVAVIEFDDTGGIVSHAILDRKTDNYIVEVPVGAWHMLIALKKNSVIYEVKDGPYSAIDDKNFARWAPAEGSSECAAYLNSVIMKLGLQS